MCSSQGRHRPVEGGGEEGARGLLEGVVLQEHEGEADKVNEILNNDSSVAMAVSGRYEMVAGFLRSKHNRSEDSTTEEKDQHSSELITHCT